MRVLSWGVLLLGLGAGSASAQAPPRPCSVTVVQSSYEQHGPAYRDCDVDQPARLRRDRAPAFVFPTDERCATAELVFVVDTTGVPDSATAVIVETDAPDFARLLVQTLASWRYRPAQLHGVLVRQVVRERRIMANGAPDGRAPATLNTGEGTPPRSSAMPPTPAFAPFCRA